MEACDALRWRCLGPHRGGRVAAVAGDPNDPLRFYFGSTGGGVFLTDDGGRAWRNVSDHHFGTASVGALAVAPSDPNVIYAGMGECNIRQNVSYGDGVYRSTDRGETWTHIGLRETRQIARIRVHPDDPDLAYVAAFGHVSGPSPERGVYRTRDGGRSWDLVLHVSSVAGAIDLTMDPRNPRILMAATWQAHRNFWELSSGGPDSRLFVSFDGGDSWSDITKNPGLPAGPLGRVGVSVSGARHGRVWAAIEAHEPGVYRSDDYGATWFRATDGRGILLRPWYYNHIFAHPTEEDTVYFAGELFWKSTDAGATFAQVPTPHGDNHDLWIDPRNPERMVQGNDGGACVSFNGGRSWSTLMNQPTAEIYHVVTDTAFPYRVYGAQQDSSTISLPSRSDQAAITQRDWFDCGGRECGSIAVRATDPGIIFAGGQRGIITRYDRRTGQRRNVMVWPEGNDGWGSADLKFRFSWNFPIVLSPHDPAVLYATGNHVFRSRDDGHTWETLSGDLTRNDRSRMARSGGPITKDNVGAETWGVVFAFAESPLAKGTLWAGTDDGLIHVSTDDGATWTDVTPSDLGTFTMVNTIEASPNDARTAYVAATRHRLDDIRPYLFVTRDLGKTWTRVDEGLPDDQFARVIREDPRCKGLLYVGTEAGLWASLDAGRHWWDLRFNLPAVPVHDIAVKDDDLVIATHGRGFWVLDDITPLHQLARNGGGPRDRATEATLFRPRDTWRVVKPSLAGIQGLQQVSDRVETSRPVQFSGTPGYIEFTSVQRRNHRGDVVWEYLDVGENPPDGVIITYALDEPASELRLEFVDADGTVVRSIANAPGRTLLPAHSGSHRVNWDLRTQETLAAAGPPYAHGDMAGPRVPPGRYRVRLTVDGTCWEEAFLLLRDPRVEATDADLRAQYALATRIHTLAERVNRAVDAVRFLRTDLLGAIARMDGSGHGGDLLKEATELRLRLDGIEQELIQPAARQWKEVRQYTARLINQIAYLANVVGSADAPPTAQSYAVFRETEALADTVFQRLNVAERDALALGTRLHEAGVPPVGRMAARAG